MYHSTEHLENQIDRLRAERDKWMEYATGDRAELALKMEALRAELADARDHSQGGEGR